MMLLPSTTLADGWIEELKLFHPYVALTAGEDSNLLATPEARSDRYALAEAGFDAEMTVSRQRFDLGGRIARIAYDRFREFDYTGGDAHAIWHWAAGRLWDGELGYRYDKRQRNFSLMEVPKKDLRERHTLFGRAGHWLTERWRLEVEANRADISFSSSAQLDAERTGSGLELNYVSEAGNSVGMRAAYATSHYPHVDGRDYEDFTVGPTAAWQATGKLKVTAQAGYTRRVHERAGRADFSGPTARLSADWQATGKTSVTASAWREVSNLQDQIPNYAIVTGVSIAPTWNITDKTALIAEAGYEQRDFQRDALTGDGKRNDDVSWVEARLEWRPREQVRVSFGGRAERRDSNRPLETYDQHRLELKVSIGL